MLELQKTNILLGINTVLLKTLFLTFIILLIGHLKESISLDFITIIILKLPLSDVEKWQQLFQVETT